MKTQRKDSFLFGEQVTTTKIVPPVQAPAGESHINVHSGKVSLFGHTGSIVRMQCSGCYVIPGQCVISKHDMIVLGKALLELAEYTEGEE